MNLELYLSHPTPAELLRRRRRRRRRVLITTGRTGLSAQAAECLPDRHARLRNGHLGRRGVKLSGEEVGRVEPGLEAISFLLNIV